MKQNSNNSVGDRSIDRHITHIIIHCSATDEGRMITASDIERWHRQLGYDGIGYHYVIRLDGTIEEGRPLSRSGAHCLGKNSCSVGICYVGGIRRGKATDTRTAAQKASLLSLLSELNSRFPDAKVYGHRDFANKACPCFDATAEYATL